jgi:hypothetical protein
MVAGGKGRSVGFGSESGEGRGGEGRKGDSRGIEEDDGINEINREATRFVFFFFRTRGGV